MSADAIDGSTLDAMLDPNTSKEALTELICNNDRLISDCILNRETSDNPLFNRIPIHTSDIALDYVDDVQKGVVDKKHGLCEYAVARHKGFGPAPLKKTSFFTTNGKDSPKTVDITDVVEHGKFSGDGVFADSLMENSHLYAFDASDKADQLIQDAQEAIDNIPLDIASSPTGMHERFKEEMDSARDATRTFQNTAQFMQQQYQDAATMHSKQIEEQQHLIAQTQKALMSASSVASLNQEILGHIGDRADEFLVDIQQRIAKVKNARSKHKGTQ